MYGSTTGEELVKRCLELAREESEVVLGLMGGHMPIKGADLVSVEAMTAVLQQEELALDKEEQVWEAVVLFARCASFASGRFAAPLPPQLLFRRLFCLVVCVWVQVAVPRGGI